MDSNIDYILTKDISSKKDIKNNFIQASHNSINLIKKLDGVFLKNVILGKELKGVSMQPTIFSGNTPLFVKFRNQSLKEGQIIFTKEGLTHRIKGIYSDKIILQGDNNEYAETIYERDIDYILIGVLYT
jgi:hypothetical protein